MAIDTVPTPDFEGMSFKKGTIRRIRGRHVLELGTRRIEIPTSVVPAPELKSFEGRTVYAAFSKSVRGALVAIGTWPTPEKRRWIVCYIPVPEIMRRIDMRVREEMLRGMVAEGIVPDAFARQVKGAG